MFFKNPRHYHYFFVAAFLIYLLAGLINLSTLPIAWTDEIQNLAPSVFLNKNGQYASPLWPNPGAEKHFFSYLPLSIIIHFPWLKLMGLSIFKARLLYFIFVLISLLLLYRFMLKYLKAGTLFASFFTLLFMLDKCNFEIMRSMRSEVIEVLLMLCLLFLLYNGKRTIQKYLATGFVLSLLLLTHLKMWPVIPVTLIYLLRKDFKLKTLLALGLPLVALPLLWMALTGFNFHSLYDQLWLQGSKHSASHSFGELFYGNFVGRFRIYFPEQFFMPLLHLLSLILVFKDLKKISATGILYLTLWISWLLILQPHHRYLPVLNLLATIITCSYALNLNFSVTRKRWLYAGVLFIASFPFFARHTMALVQRHERDPKAFATFMDKYISSDKPVLLTGNSLGFYYAASHPHMDYMIDFYPQHYNFSSYNKIYYITTDSLPLKKLGTYLPEQPQWLIPLRKLVPKGKAVTYYGNNIYEVNSKEEWDSLFKRYMDY